jgi:hypothetical protein
MFHHTLTVKRLLAAGLAIGAAGFPAVAQARFGLGPGDGPDFPVVSAAISQPPVHSTQESFDWGDAGIGAAGAVVLLSAGAFGASATRRRGRPAVC